MSLMISKTFKGESHFPETAWGVVGKSTATDKEPEEALIMVRPEDQRGVAEYLAEVLSSQSPAEGLEIPDGATEFEEYKVILLRHERTLENQLTATATYVPKEP